MGAGTPAIALLTEHGVRFTLHEYELEPLSGVDQHRGGAIELEAGEGLSVPLVLSWSA